MASEAFHIDTSGENVLQTGATTLELTVETSGVGPADLTVVVN